MVEIFNNCHIVILPSYREGVPKSLIEACAVGRAIITTDAVGCRECVDEGILEPQTGIFMYWASEITFPKPS